MHTPRHPTRSITIMASALLALFLLSFVLGRYGVPLGEVVKILLSRVFSIEQTWTDNMAIAVWNVRLPRILLACLVGCGLSAAGTAYQTVFQNPMAAPDILGASSGACFGAALAILLTRCLLGGLFAGNLSAMLFSVLGGLTAMLVMIFLRRLPKLSVYGVSIGGAAAHNVGQMAAAVITLGSTMVLGYLPFLLAVSLFTGTLTGFITALLLRATRHIRFH